MENQTVYIVASRHGHNLHVYSTMEKAQACIDKWNETAIKQFGSTRNVLGESFYHIVEREVK